MKTLKVGMLQEIQNWGLINSNSKQFTSTCGALDLLRKGLWVSQAKETLIDKQTKEIPLSLWQLGDQKFLFGFDWILGFPFVFELERELQAIKEDGDVSRLLLFHAQRERERERSFFFFFFDSNSDSELEKEREKFLKIENWKMEKSVGHWESFYFVWGRWKWKYPA